MKRLFFLFVALFLAGKVSAQVPQRPGATQQPAPPLASRQVSGIVKDSTDSPVIGAIVSLTSPGDTLKVSTNAEGIFVFRVVKAWEFKVTASSLGYVGKTVSGKFSATVPRVTMDPIILRSGAQEMNAIVLNGTPSIVYKTDTVEYRASDYVVRAGATVDELLKKMEGMEVGSDGSLTYNGTSIGKAKLNGKEIFGGDMATVIQNLPAEIIEKAQVVDDYGDQARRTGIKEGDPQKVLNLTTRTDKSVGLRTQLNGGLGTTDRREGSANITRLNGNRNLGVNVQVQKTPNGIAGGNANVGRLSTNRGFGGGGGGSNGSGGTTTSVSPLSFTYRDTWSKKIEVNGSYTYNYSNPFTISSTISQQFQSATPTSVGGTVYGSVEGRSESISHQHQASFDLEYNIDSANYMQIRPTFSFSKSMSDNNSTNIRTGATQQDQLTRQHGNSSTPNVGATIAYQHIFRKPGRTFSMETTLSRNTSDNATVQNNVLNFYEQGTNNKLPDSIVHRRTDRNNINTSTRVSLTYSEPLSPSMRFEFNSNMTRRGYDNSATQSNLDAFDNAKLIDSLSNIFNYTFTQYRNSVNFRYGANNATKVNYSIGLTALNTSLNGTKVTLGGAKTNQDYFKLIPIARFQFRFSRQHQISLNYQGNANEPTFDQIQPVRDLSDPQRPLVGNPNLKVAFTHSINAQYGNYLANSKLNLTLGLNTSISENAVTSNQVTIDNIKVDPVSGKTYNNQIRETRYVNLNGGKSSGASYGIQKSFNNRKYSLSLTGTVNNSHRLTMDNSKVYPSDTWQFTESFGPRINPTTWLEINPYASYDYSKATYTIPNATNTEVKRFALSLDGNVYFLKTFQFGYALSKNFVSGIGNNVTNNPFIINTSLQTRVLKGKGSLQIRAFDLLKQNNSLNRTNTATGFSDTKTNTQSRYFMVNLSMNLQKWTGAQGRNGRAPMRRNDGSFIVN